MASDQPVKEKKMSETQPITLVDCGCRSHVYGDGSGVEIYYCDLHDAAEDLLVALKRAREALKANEEISGTWELYQHSPEMKAINAAIAKAEGDPVEAKEGAEV